MPPAPSITIWTTSAWALFSQKPVAKAHKPEKPPLLSPSAPPDVLHGSRTLVIKDEQGEVAEPYSISAGLDYPGIGPLFAHLITEGRIQVEAITDREALTAAFELSRSEGIIPALESSHALAVLSKLTFRPDEVVVLTVSGRGDKDLETYLSHKAEILGE